MNCGTLAAVRPGERVLDIGCGRGAGMAEVDGKILYGTTFF